MNTTSTSRPDGILVYYNATITDSTVKTSSAHGNGIDCGEGSNTLTIKNSTIEANSERGGGLYCEGNIVLDNSTITASGKDTTWAWAVIQASGGNIDITDCVMNIVSGTDVLGMYADGNLSFHAGQGSLDTNIDIDSRNANENKFAIRLSNKNPGVITLDDNLEIVLPEKGTIGKVDEVPTILDGESAAKHVTIKEKEGIDPQPEPVPQPAPKVSKAKLLAKATAKGTKSLVISWNKISGAEGYDIYFAKCKKNNSATSLKRIKTVKADKISLTKTSLKTKTAYKVRVKAWVMKDGKKSYVKTSPVVHAYTAGGNKTYTNPKSVSVNKTKLSLKKGKTFQIKATVYKLKKSKKLMPTWHCPKVRYLSSNTAIAKVTSKGKIKAIAKGTCKVYVYAANGVKKTISVTVK